MTTLNPTHFPTTTYQVEDSTSLQLGEQENTTKISYDILLKSLPNNEVSIERRNFKVDGKEVTTKYLNLSNQYFESLFPLKLKTVNNRLVLANYKEIINRAADKDKELKKTYQGGGIEQISSQFLQAIGNEEKGTNFVKGLYFMKVLNFLTQKSEQTEDYILNWDILPIANTKWTGKMNYLQEENQLHYEPKIANAQEFVDALIHYSHNNELNLTFPNEDMSIFSNFIHKTEFQDESVKSKTSETLVQIDIDNIIKYEQKITFKYK